MQTKCLTACTMGVLGRGIDDLCVFELYGIMERFPEWRFPHKQDFYSLIYIEKASGSIIIDEFEILLNTTKVLILKPGCVSNIRIDKNAKGKVICFTEAFFSLGYHNNVLNEFSFINGHDVPSIEFDNNQHNRWSTIINLFCKEYVYRAKHANKVLRSYLNILLFELERNHHPKNIKKRNTLGKNRISTFRKMIETHYKNKKSPSEYAFLLNITTNHLNKVCKQEVGKTAGTFIRNYLCIEARRLLYHTDYTVGEIANELGFKNVPYFSTFFKKQTGNTPEEYRREIL